MEYLVGPVVIVGGIVLIIGLLLAPLKLYDIDRELRRLNQRAENIVRMMAAIANEVTKDENGRPTHGG